MHPLHNLKRCMILGFRTGLITFFLFLMIDLLILKEDNFMNFVMIIIISFICAFFIGTTSFVKVYAKRVKHLKSVAHVFMVVSLVLIIYLQLPFIRFLLFPPPPEKAGDIVIKIGKIDMKEITHSNYVKNDIAEPYVEKMETPPVMNNPNGANKSIMISIG